MQPVDNQAKIETPSPVSDSAPSQEEQLRAQIYQLLAGFLTDFPVQDKLDAAARLEGDNSPLGQAFTAFSQVAKSFDVTTAKTEYHDLFIGVTRGELVPFGSYYLTGFLNEKPLALLRSEMARLGIERVENQKEPEDHIASVLEIMAGLIDGAFIGQTTMAEQKEFFEKHIASWATHFFSDLEKAKHSVLYAPLATIGRLFMEIEQDAFEMVDA